ncbi:MAG: GrpB family protein [Candidatus Heimdallarchaeota archaeon]|nr:GrpB family protein [Candidatus Heimdallarchaeota archaeon]MBY8995664.1 GrpB family protein [Candidatus Heimdallarchaeota archaeon]
MSSPIILEKYNPKWPDFFLEERAKIEKALGHLIVKIEHIGSTAIPGMGGNPIIDILIGVQEKEDAEKCIPLLASIGYTFDPDRNEDFPERKSLDKYAIGAKIHLYIVDINSEYWVRHILFRDHLRANPEVAREYNKLKVELVKKYRYDREAYTKGKAKFIKKVEDITKKERQMYMK